MNCSPPGSSVPGLLQARALEWAASSSCGGLADAGVEAQSPGLPRWRAGSLPLAPLGRPRASCVSVRPVSSAAATPCPWEPCLSAPLPLPWRCALLTLFRTHARAARSCLPLPPGLLLAAGSRAARARRAARAQAALCLSCRSVSSSSP